MKRPPPGTGPLMSSGTSSNSTRPVELIVETVAESVFESQQLSRRDDELVTLSVASGHVIDRRMRAITSAASMSVVGGVLRAHQPPAPNVARRTGEHGIRCHQR